LAGLIHVACGTPWHGDFPPRQSRLIRLLCRAIPLFRIFPGYFPGELMGFAGRESLQLMRDWRDWALTGTLDYGGRTGVAQAAGRFEGPVISIAIENDDFNSVAARDRALSPLRNARITRLTLGAAQQGEYLGHFKWARQPDGVVRALADWMQRELV
jgi:predicted alpha/beta hydrolase